MGEKQNAVETVQALRFGERCSKVQNEATESAAALARALEKLAAQIKEGEAAIQQNEKWVQRKIKRKDFDAETGETTEEVITTSVLAGAEAEREQLHQLMKKQAELLGEDVAETEWDNRITSDVNSVLTDATKRNIK